MKKQVIYLSLLSTLAVPNAMAVHIPNDDASVESSPPSILKEKPVEKGSTVSVESLFPSPVKEKKYIIEGDNASIEDKKNTFDSLNAILKGIPGDNLIKQIEYLKKNWIEENPDYHKLILSRREQGEIGDKAWELLRGENRRLTKALFEAINKCPGQTVDVSYYSTDCFKLSINKKSQSKLYKF